ncbi:hypothetical protein [Streptomyces sp. NPDC021224]|uniref:hypothetical protein n=1 Tax=unclassified Streptomyces TaxID=2593676 RepID=UPI00378B0CCC
MKRARYNRRRGCEGKKAHPDRDAARAHMLDLVARGATGLNVYRCRRCSRFHVGHRRHNA